MKKKIITVITIIVGLIGLSIIGIILCKNTQSVKQEKIDDSGENIFIFAEDSWTDITKLIYYDFDGTVYEIADEAGLEEIKTIFTKLEYEEIENPWIEGWYRFDVCTHEKKFSLGITGDVINFDGRFYKVTDSVAKDVVEIVK